METANRDVLVGALGQPGCAVIVPVRDELELQPRRIRADDGGIAEAIFHVVDSEPAVGKPVAPERQRSGGDRERGDRNLAGALLPDGHAVVLVGKCRPERARAAAAVAVVEVVDVVVVEVDRLLDEPQTERADAEIEIILRVVNRGRHVVETEDGMRHQPARIVADRARR